MSRDKRILFISDTHCGDDLGLTPANLVRPGFVFAEQMKEYWSWWRWALSKAGSFDIVIDCGDMVHGNPKNNSRSLNTNDMDMQVQIAILVRKEIKTNKGCKWRFCFGTDIHVGGQMDHEKRIAEHFGGVICTEQRIEINGFAIAAIHKRGFGKSSNPSGSGSALGKAGVNTYIGEISESREYSKLMINGHIHDYQGYYNSKYHVISLPALQIGHRDVTPYARGFVSSYDVGFLAATITKQGRILFDEPYLMRTKFVSNDRKGEYETL